MKFNMDGDENLGSWDEENALIGNSEFRGSGSSNLTVFLALPNARVRPPSRLASGNPVLAPPSFLLTYFGQSLPI